MNAVDTVRLNHVYPAHRRVPARTALSDVDLTVAAGSVFGLLGPNGGGKTTLFKILSSLLRPTSGDARVFGESVIEAPEKARRRLGVVFQHPSLDKKLTLLENLRHHGRLYGLSGRALAAAADETLSRLSLSDRRNDLVEHLSGGLQRRGEIAKCLMHRPDLLLMDEPSTGLDPAARRELWDTLGELRRAGVTVLLTTHLMEEGDRCDRVGILNQGRLLVEGRPDDLKNRIGADVIEIQARDAQTLAGEIGRKFGTAPQLLDGTLRLELRDGHKFVPQLVEAFPGAIHAVSVGKPTLEDVFIHATGQRLEVAP